MQHTVEELKQMQALPLSVKIAMSKSRIREWVREFGEDGVYISFSGGKDSTVLLDIARQEYPNLKAVFLDTGLEFPEIREHVKTFDNVDWIKPDLTFKQAIQQYGYPFFSKKVSNIVYYARQHLRQGRTDTAILKKMSKDNNSRYSVKRYNFMLQAPFEINSRCCNIFKKNPSHKYERRTGRHKITGQLACESQLRMQKWLINGCNAFDIEYPCSNPLSFWTEQDVLKYIYEKNLPIASIYGEVVKEASQPDLFGNVDETFKTTGVDRTGCVFCGFGLQLEKEPNRLQKLKKSHPKLYEYIMKPTSEGGLGYKEIIDWINENGGFNIKY